MRVVTPDEDAHCLACQDYERAVLSSRWLDEAVDRADDEAVRAEAVARVAAYKATVAPRPPKHPPGWRPKDRTLRAYKRSLKRKKIRYAALKLAKVACAGVGQG